MAKASAENASSQLFTDGNERTHGKAFAGSRSSMVPAYRLPTSRIVTASCAFASTSNGSACILELTR